MRPDAYAAQVSSNFQGLFSNVLMGMREGRAQEEQSLRRRAFEQEQQVQKFKMDEYLEKRELEKTEAFGMADFMRQQENLTNLASGDQHMELSKSKYQDVNIPGASPQALARFNNAAREKYNLNKAALLSASTGQKHRLDDINSLSEYAESLQNDPVKRAEADESRALLQAGMAVSDLGEKNRNIMSEAAQYKAKRTLESNPTFAAKRLDLMSAARDNKTKQLSDAVTRLESVWKTIKTVEGQAVAGYDKEYAAKTSKEADGAFRAYQSAQAALNAHLAEQTDSNSAANAIGMAGDQGVSYNLKVNDNGVVKLLKVTPTQLRQAYKSGIEILDQSPIAP